MSKDKLIKIRILLNFPTFKKTKKLYPDSPRINHKSITPNFKKVLGSILKKLPTIKIKHPFLIQLRLLIDNI